MPTLHPTNGQSHPGEITKVQPTARRWRVKKTSTAIGISRDIVQEEQFNGQDVLVALRSAENAPLVAAAPDLLAAAQLWIAHYDQFVRQDALGDEPGIGDLRAAIAKATSK